MQEIIYQLLILIMGIINNSPLKLSKSLFRREGRKNSQEGTVVEFLS